MKHADRFFLPQPPIALRGDEGGPLRKDALSRLSRRAAAHIGTVIEWEDTNHQRWWSHIGAHGARELTVEVRHVAHHAFPHFADFN